MDNYYKILNVNKNADVSEIKKAYLKELKKYHPDVYKGDSSFAQNKTAQLNEIYSTLKDDNLRKEYDLKFFGEEDKEITKEAEPNIFRELKERLKTNFAKYSNKNQKEKNQKEKNQKEKNQKSKVIKNKDKKDDINNKNKKEIIIQENNIENIEYEKKERIRLSIMIGSIILCFLLIIIFCLII